MTSPPAPHSAPPAEIRLSADRARLTLVWSDGLAQELPAARLRAHSPSAGEKRLRIDGIAGEVAADLTLRDVRLLGRYGLNLVFSDGHDRGIYPWALLKELCEPTACADSGAPSPANAIP